MDGVDSHDIFLVTFRFDLADMCLWPSQHSPFTITFHFPVLLEAQQTNSFFIFHLLADEHCNIQLWMANKHDLLLNHAVAKRATTNVFIRKINLNIAKEALNVSLV